PTGARRRHSLSREEAVRPSRRRAHWPLSPAGVLLRRPGDAVVRVGHRRALRVRWRREQGAAARGVVIADPLACARPAAACGWGTRARPMLGPPAPALARRLPISPRLGGRPC